MLNKYFLNEFMNFSRSKEDSAILDKQLQQSQASQVALVAKNLAVRAGDVRDMGSIPGSGRSSGGGHGNALYYSCLAYPTDRGAQWVTVRMVAKSRTQLKQLSMYVNRQKSGFTGYYQIKIRGVQHSRWAYSIQWGQLFPFNPFVVFYIH